MQATVKVQHGGRVSIPAQIRHALELEDGELIEVDIRQPDELGGSESDQP